MAVTPTRNLPPEAEPWGRFIEAEVKQIKTDVASLKQMVDNTLLGVNGALKRMGDQIKDLNDLVTAQQILTAQLIATQAQQAAQLAAINALVATQVDGITGTNSASPTLNTTPTGYAALTFTVPAGYTRAQIMGVSAMYAGGTVASILRTQIAGVNGPDMYAFTNAAYANATASSAASLSGLTGGGTVTVQSVANTTTSTTSAVILTTAIVTWLK